MPTGTPCFASVSQTQARIAATASLATTPGTLTSPSVSKASRCVDWSSSSIRWAMRVAKVDGVGPTHKGDVRRGSDRA